MGLSTFSVGTAVTPTVIETWCSHYLNRKPRKQKPTAHITYDVGLNLIKQFLAFAAKNSVDDLQAFTSQWAPAPPWVRTDNVYIPQSDIIDAAHHLQNELGSDGLHAVGGPTWWQWRHKDHKLQAEWIEMRKDHDLRARRGEKCLRSMLYVHGGAYYFGSVDAHRYQIQRHARKLQARILAPRYRLAPQYPFPCGLLDCLATYLHLLNTQPPETIVLAGDCWRSCAETNHLDYVPSDGFLHAPSMSWPPPNSDELKTLDDIVDEMQHGRKRSTKQVREEAERRSSRSKQAAGDTANVTSPTQTNGNLAHQINAVPGIGNNPSVLVDGKRFEIKDQLQLYGPNHLLSYPLVSPIMQPSLGGLPPLCILVGGSEMLRDEQIYLAHKAADPALYPPPILGDEAQKERIRSDIHRWPATFVQLQIWDDLCHVAPTLSFTRPAKYMYRSVAQFSAWALARAQRSEIRILNDDEVSLISSDSEAESSEGSRQDSGRGSNASKKMRSASKDAESAGSSSRVPRRRSHRPDTPTTVGRAGDPLPSFRDHIIRHRVTRYGDLYPLDAPSTLVACTMDPHEIGSVKAGPVRKWLAGQERLDVLHHGKKKKLQMKIIAQMVETVGGRGAVYTEGREHSMIVGQERPPPTAWAGRSKEQIAQLLKGREKRRISKGLAMWSGWGSKHDEQAIEAEELKVKNKEDITVSVTSVRVRNRPSMDILGGAKGLSVAGSSAAAMSTSEERPTRQPATTHRAVTPSRTERNSVPLQPFSTPTALVTSGYPQTFLADPGSPPMLHPPPPTAVPSTATPDQPRSGTPTRPAATASDQPGLAIQIDAQEQDGNISAELAARARLGPTQRMSTGDGNPIPDSATLPAQGTPYRYSHRSVYSHDMDVPPTPVIPENFRAASVQEQHSQGKAVMPSQTMTDGDSPNTASVIQSDGLNSDVLPPSTAANTSPRGTNLSSESLDDDDDVQLVAAQAVPIQTVEAARREHARQNSKVYSFGGGPGFRDSQGVNRISIASRGDGVVPLLRKSTDAVNNAEDLDHWADRVISEVRTVGSRDGPPVIDSKSFENSGP